MTETEALQIKLDTRRRRRVLYGETFHEQEHIAFTDEEVAAALARIEALSVDYDGTLVVAALNLKRAHEAEARIEALSADLKFAETREAVKKETAQILANALGEKTAAYAALQSRVEQVARAHIAHGMLEPFLQELGIDPWPAPPAVSEKP